MRADTTVMTENDIEVVFNAEDSVAFKRLIFADMLTCYTNRLFDRQKEAHAKLQMISFHGTYEDAREQFDRIYTEWKDADECISRVSTLDGRFKASYPK